MSWIAEQLIKGTPGAILVGVLYVLVVSPLSGRVEKLVDELNREVIPTVNLLVKRTALDSPQIRDLGEVGSNGDITLKNAQVAGVDQQGGRIFLFMPALRRAVALPVQVEPDSKIVDDKGRALSISEVKRGQHLSSITTKDPALSEELSNDISYSF
jgi:hypothetical protein